MSVATATALTLVGMGVTAGTGVYSAHKVSSSANRAARETTSAANHAADLQRQSEQETLAFTKQQAEAKAKQDEADRHANYDQWRAREQRLGSIGAALGYGQRNIPDYVPGSVPSYGQPAPPGAPRPGSETFTLPDGRVVTPGGIRNPSGPTVPVQAGPVPAPAQQSQPSIGASLYQDDQRALQMVRGIPVRKAAPAQPSMGAALYGTRY